MEKFFFVFYKKHTCITHILYLNFDLAVSLHHTSKYVILSEAAFSAAKSKNLRTTVNAKILRRCAPQNDIRFSRPTASPWGEAVSEAD